MSKRTDSPGLGSLGSGALTAFSSVVVTVVAGIAGIVIARNFGRTDETDGFFAAYGVFIVVVIASFAIRVAVLPSLARARAERRLAGEIAGYALAIAAVAVPVVVFTELASRQLALVLTGDGPSAAQSVASESLRWMVPAAAAHLFAGLAASGLAALDDYATAAAGYAAGSAAGLALILTRVAPNGIIAVAWGMALNATIALLVPLVALGWRARVSRMPATAARPAGTPLSQRLGGFAAAAALPIALQLLYVVCLPFAARIGTGAVTSFGYAYLASAGLVTATAVSLGLVTSVPLTRMGIDARRAATHVVATAWLALALIGAAAGVFALAGGHVVRSVLGTAYGGNVGTEVGRLVVVLSPWIFASVGVNVTFPLLFVVRRTRRLPWIGLGALALQVPLAAGAGSAFGLDGLALALALTTLLVLGALLRQLGALAATSRGLVTAALFTAALTVFAFVPPSFVFGTAVAAVVGVVVYCTLTALTRDRGLTASWAYLRALR